MEHTSILYRNLLNENILGSTVRLECRQTKKIENCVLVILYLLIVQAFETIDKCDELKCTSVLLYSGQGVKYSQELTTVMSRAGLEQYLMIIFQGRHW